MEYINLIKTLTNELEIAKNKIHKLKVKLSMKELDIMNLKKEQICLLLEYNEYNTEEEIGIEQEIVIPVQEPNIYVKPVANINIGCNITDSLLLNHKNKLKSVDINNIPKKLSTGISKSIIINQRNNLKHIINTNNTNIIPIKDDSDYAYMINAIIAKRYDNDDDTELTESWI